jgi:ABC-type transport system involved in multi-copper enzyme maturation permease subunit
MIGQVRAELLKERSTATLLGLVVGLVVLVVVVILVHGVQLPAQSLGRRESQLVVIGRGGFLATLFAALLGALSITGEIRHGTIRPTFLVAPWRGRVIAAKVMVSSLIGAGFGVVASAVAVGVLTAVLQARGIGVELGRADYALMIGGSTAASALWAAIGVGVGALVRQQVPAMVGFCAWVLFVEGLLVGDTGWLGDVGKVLPGAAATALTGQQPASGVLLSPWQGGLVLVLYAMVAAAAGWVATARRDVP